MGGGAVLNDSPVGCQTRTVTEPQRVAEGGGAGVNDCQWQSEPRRDRAAASSLPREGKAYAGRPPSTDHYSLFTIHYSLIFSLPVPYICRERK